MPDLTDVVARMEALAAAVAALVAADPRPVRLIYGRDIEREDYPNIEVRWHSSRGDKCWSEWHRVTSPTLSSIGQAWVYLVGPNVNVHRDEPLEVRPVMDLQTGGMTTNAQRHDDWTPSELSRFAIDAEHATLMRETLGGEGPIGYGSPGWLRARITLRPNDDADDVQATLNWLVAHHEAVGRDIDRVREHLAGLLAAAEAEKAWAYDEGCGAR